MAREGNVSEPVYGKMSITNLLLYLDNPRFDPVEHQSEAINAMVRDQKGKLVALGQDIAIHGLNPAAPVLVKSYDANGKQWVVREGNRRITALKLIIEPSLVPSDLAKLRREFQRLGSLIDMELLENIPCVVLEDENQINKWVALAHMGENSGVGTVGWNAQQTSRFRSVVGKTDMRLAFLDELRLSDDVPQSLKDKIGSIKKTNFDRLMEDPDVRKLLGLSIVECRIRLVGGVNPYLLMVIDDLACGKLRVKDIYLESDREKYMDSLRQRKANRTLPPSAAQPHSGTGSSYDPSQADSNDPHAQPTTSPLDNQAAPTNNSKRLASYPVNRKTLIPTDQTLTIPQHRILRIFRELKSISVEDYPNAVAVLFRTFIESSADYYAKNNGLVDKRLNVDSTISVKVDGVATYIENNSIMTKHELRPIRQMASSETQNCSVKTFNSYVHNMNITPSSVDLRSAWDDIWPFVQQIWK